MLYAILWYDEQGYDRVKLCFIIFCYQNISTRALMSACDDTLFMDDTNTYIGGVDDTYFLTR